MKKLIIIILLMLSCGLAHAGTTQVSPVSNSNQTPVINDNFDNLQTGVNSLAGAYQTMNGYFVNGTLAVAHGGTGMNTLTDIGLPSQGGHSGQYLTTNGSASGWGSVTQYIPQYKTGIFTSTTSADLTASGLGFTPKYILLYASIADSGITYGSSGFDDGTNKSVCEMSGASQISNSYSIMLLNGGATISAYVSSIVSGGFTISWAGYYGGGQTIRIMYVAIG